MSLAKSLSQFKGFGLCLIGCTTVGISLNLLTEPTGAQIAQNSLSNRTQNVNRDIIFYEFKDTEVRICRKLSDSTKGKDKECTAIGKGYSTGLRIANELYKDKNYSNAESLYRQLVERYPKQAEAYYKLGSLFLAQNNMTEAITQFKKAISIQTDHAKARNDLAIALAGQGNLDEAITEWRTAVKINPDFPDALTNLGLALVQQGQTTKDEGVNYLKKAQNLFLKQGRNQQADRIDKFLQQIAQSSGES